MARYKMTREFFIPTDGVKIEREGLIGAEAYKYECRGKLCAMMFIGKQAKPAMNYKYATIERRDAAIDEFFDNQAKVAEFKKERAAAAKARKEEAKANVKVGDIFCGSWGYDQTNQEFYQVVQKKGGTCKLQEIGKKIVETQQTCEYVRPAPDIKIGEPVTKRINQSGGFTFDVFNLYPDEGRPRYQTAWGCGH
jgi:hypothetical protein